MKDRTNDHRSSRAKNTMRDGSASKTRIVILGGGAGGVVTASRRRQRSTQKYVRFRDCRAVLGKELNHYELPRY
jgi:hypothetical protein